MIKNGFFILACSFFLLSCGQKGDPLEEPQADQVGDPLPTVRAFEAAEAGIGKRTCLALQHKDRSFRSTYLGSEIDFLFTTINCGQVISDKLPARLKVGVSEFASDLNFESVGRTGRFFRDIQTDRTLPLVHVCADLIDGKRPVNTYDTVTGVEKVKLRFLQIRIGSRDYDTVQLTYYVKNAKGEYRASRLQESLIHTGDDSGKQLKGIALRRTEVTRCSADPTLSSLFRQTLDF